MFQGSLELAYQFIKIASIVIVVVLAFALLLKARLIYIKKKKDAFTAKHESYFQYLQCDPDDTSVLKKPPGRLSRLELEVIQGKLGEWIDRLKGSHQEKLIALSEELGLVDANMRRLGSKFGWRRVTAAYHLGMLRAKQAAPVLLELARNEKNTVNFLVFARAAALCMEKASDLKQLMERFANQNKPAYSLAADVYTRSPAADSKLLEEMLRSKDIRMVKLAVHCLKGQAYAHLAPNLLKLIDHEDRELRMLAAEAYLHSSPELAQGIVSKLIKHEDEEIRALTARAIGELGNAAYIETLKHAMTDSSWKVRRNSAVSLAMFEEKGFAVLCEVAIHGKDPFSKDMASDVIWEERMKERVMSGDASGAALYRNKQGNAGINGSNSLDQKQVM